MMNNKFFALFIIMSFSGVASEQCVATQLNQYASENDLRQRKSESKPLLKKSNNKIGTDNPIKNNYNNEIINEYILYCKENNINANFEKILKDFESIKKDIKVFDSNSRIYKNHLMGQYCVPKHLLDPFYKEMVRIIKERKLAENQK